MSVIKSIAFLLLVFLLGTIPGRLRASYAFYVGKDLTVDGSVIIGGTGEEVSSHWLEVVPRKVHPKGAMIKVGVTGQANLPGKLVDIPQARKTWRYITMNYTDYKGFPPPLTNGGMNEWHVAARDVWRPSRKEMVEMTPNPQQGPNYSDLSRIVLERARTAREAVKIVGELIERHGYSTYGGNSHLFADPNEGWIVIEVAGGQGIWAAERLAADEVRVLYPGYIGNIPRNYLSHRDYMGSKNLISFAVKKGWYAPNKGEAFNFHQVYCRPGQDMRRPGIKYVDPATLEDDLMRYAPKITVAHMMAAVRDYRICDDEAGYGQVAHLRKGVPRELGVLWVAPTGSIAAPFIPIHIGCQKVPMEFSAHRYLTKAAGKTFLSRDYQIQEATLFAGRLYKRLMYYACEQPDRYLPELTETFEAFEGRAAKKLKMVQDTALVLKRAKREDLLRYELTESFRVFAHESLQLGKNLLASIEARQRLLPGLRQPKGEKINEPAQRGRETIHARKRIGTTRQRYGLYQYDQGSWKPHAEFRRP